MNLIRYNPWTLLDDFFEDRPERPHHLEHWIPAVDIKEEKDSYHIHADLPGVSLKDIDVTVENNMLTIKGSRDTKSKESSKDYTRIERISGKFVRRFTLPDDADPNKIDAHSKDGVLDIVIPKKAEHVVSKRIEVKIKEN